MEEIKMVGTLGKIALYSLAGYAAFTLCKGCTSEKKELSISPEYKNMELYSSSSDLSKLEKLPKETKDNPYVTLEKKL